MHEAFAVVGMNADLYIHTNPDHFRPGEVVPLCGDSSKARQALPWQPTKTFEQIVKEMVLADIEHLERNQ
ncbi:GDP-mannose 4,6-dehydratase [compost metagenome]